MYFTDFFFQTEGTYMFNLDGLIPKICPLAHELREEERTIHLCSAGLQALSSLELSSYITQFVYPICKKKY